MEVLGTCDLTIKLLRDESKQTKTTALVSTHIHSEILISWHNLLDLQVINDAFPTHADCRKAKNTEHTQEDNVRGTDEETRNVHTVSKEVSNDTRLQENKKNATCEQPKPAENEPCERESVTHSSNKQIAATESETEKIKKCNKTQIEEDADTVKTCLLYTSPSPRDGLLSRMPSSA